MRRAAAAGETPMPEYEPDDVDQMSALATELAASAGELGLER
jgi:hypothetical protein